MNKFLNLILYYLLLLLGLCVSSWIIWSRFLRERTIRDIPDYLFTEYRFWLLLYISCIYIYVIKNLIFPKESNPVIKDIIEIIFTPLKTLDHAIKYNKKIKSYYYKLIIKFLVFASTKHFNKVHIFIFFMQIFPRIILVTFLLLDTFYFCKLEIFYKIVLIGILPLILRYCKYSLKDIYEHWILALEDKYKSVKIYEEDYEFDNDRKNNTGAIYHHERKTIREYIEIKFENILTYDGEKIDYEYNATPYPQKEFLIEYVLKKYNSMNLRKYTGEDLEIMSSLYKELMPSIIELKLLLYRLEIINETKTIHWSKIIIFSLYLICWSYILIISYSYYPIEFLLGKYFLFNLMTYLYIADNPFAELFWGSLNENLITIEKIKYIFSKIIEK